MTIFAILLSHLRSAWPYYLLTISILLNCIQHELFHVEQLEKAAMAVTLDTQNKAIKQQSLQYQEALKQSAVIEAKLKKDNEASKAKEKRIMSTKIAPDCQSAINWAIEQAKQFN
jgi:hypothetical protein